MSVIARVYVNMEVIHVGKLIAKEPRVTEFSGKLTRFYLIYHDVVTETVQSLYKQYFSH